METKDGVMVQIRGYGDDAQRLNVLEHNKKYFFSEFCTRPVVHDALYDSPLRVEFVVTRLTHIREVNEEIKWTEALRKISSEIPKCVLCYQSCLAPPITQCLNSHIICNLCVVRLNYCPHCNQTISVRNHAVENLLLKLSSK